MKYEYHSVAQYHYASPTVTRNFRTVPNSYNARNIGTS